MSDLSHHSWVERRSVLIDGIRALQPNLAAFAESIKTDEYDHVADLLGPGFSLVHSKARDSNGMGISIASRLPLGTLQEVDLNGTPRTAGFACTTLVVKARPWVSSLGASAPAAESVSCAPFEGEAGRQETRVNMWGATNEARA
jgi:hypothetical protein